MVVNMHNPALNPEIAGKRQRHVIRTNKGSIRVVRFDRDSNLALNTLREALEGTQPGDTVSASLVVRRAVQHFGHFISQSEPQVVALEKERVRRNSHLSHRRPLTPS